MENLTELSETTTDNRSLKSKVEKKEQVTNLNWTDLVFLSNQSWGLRHVSKEQRAIKEFNEGVHGDALAISAISRLVEKSIPTNSQAVEIAGLSSNLKSIERITTEEEKRLLLRSFEDAVKEFLLDSVGRDLNLITGEKEILLAILEKMKSGTSFIIAQFQGAKYPYDVERYYGLGKCGKQRVLKDEVIGLILPTKESSVLGFSQEELETPLDGKLFYEARSRLGDQYWQKFVELIKNNH